jgi:hypothetical protein
MVFVDMYIIIVDLLAYNMVFVDTVCTVLLWIY